MVDGIDLNLSRLRAAYASGALTPAALVDQLADALEQPLEGVWIHRRSRDELLADAHALPTRFGSGTRPPLYGVPFAVKDNMDVAGLMTTAACPAYAYRADVSAPVVEKLLAAGGILVGKTNLDQLATGLVGVRSPFGIPRNPFDARYIVGGSSSGSAVAVARGLVSFALGSDTAGSGRVPAAFTNLVGLKPSRGLISTRGMVPLCRSLDCVAVLAPTAQEAAAVADLCRGHDPGDPASRPEADGFRFAPTPSSPASPAPRFGVPPPSDLALLDPEAERLYASAVAHLQAVGGAPVAVSLAPFREAAALMYGGPWSAERLVPFEELLARDPSAILPAVRQTLETGRGHTGTDVFRALQRLEALRQQVRFLWRDIDLILVPTTPTIHTIDEIAADPLRLNARLSTFTSFVNLLDLAAVSVPAGFRGDGLPAGVSLVGPRDSDAQLLAIGARVHERTSGAASSP
jgi:allophanate hydrolase